MPPKTPKTRNTSASNNADLTLYDRLEGKFNEMEEKFKEMEIKCKNMFISEMDNKFMKVVKELEEVKKSISFMSDHVD